MAAKTKMCRNYLNGGCKYGVKCTFAHSESELARPAKKSLGGLGPCWYYNHGGCTKRASECSYTHVIDPTMRKPLHLQHPCVFYHLRTPGKCTRIDRGCKGDHDYVLTDGEWKYHFANEPRPVEEIYEPEEEAYDPEIPTDEPEPTLKEPVLQELESSSGSVIPAPPNSPELEGHKFRFRPLDEIDRFSRPLAGGAEPKSKSFLTGPFLSGNWADDENDDGLFEKLKAYVDVRPRATVNVSIID